MTERIEPRIIACINVGSINNEAFNSFLVPLTGEMPDADSAEIKIQVHGCSPHNAAKIKGVLPEWSLHSTLMWFTVPRT